MKLSRKTIGDIKKSIRRVLGVSTIKWDVMKLHDKGFDVTEWRHLPKSPKQLKGEYFPLKYLQDQDIVDVSGDGVAILVRTSHSIGEETFLVVPILEKDVGRAEIYSDYFLTLK